MIVFLFIILIGMCFMAETVSNDRRWYIGMGLFAALFVVVIALSNFMSSKKYLTTRYERAMVAKSYIDNNTLNDSNYVIYMRELDVIREYNSDVKRLQDNYNSITIGILTNKYVTTLKEIKISE